MVPKLVFIFLFIKYTILEGYCLHTIYYFSFQPSCLEISVNLMNVYIFVNQVMGLCFAQSLLPVLALVVYATQWFFLVHSISIHGMPFMYYGSRAWRNGNKERIKVSDLIEPPLHHERQYCWTRQPSKFLPGSSVYAKTSS